VKRPDDPRRPVSFLEVDMISFRTSAWMAIVVASLFIATCVTINIYFPAEKVESAAGEIVSDVRGKSSKEDENSQEKKKDQESEKKQKTSLLRGALRVHWPSPAWAGQETTVSNPTIRALKDAMKARYSEMKPYYERGILLEGNDGYVSMKSTEGLGLKERRDLTSLVEAENRDRKKLYTEVVKALNIDPSQTGRVAEIFAKEWQKTLPR
jgi:hypothetical protein